MMRKSPGARERKAVENIVKNKISVSPQRYEELLDLERRVSSGSVSSASLNMHVVMLTPPLSDDDNRRSSTADEGPILEAVDKVHPTEQAAALGKALGALRDAIAVYARWSLSLIAMPEDDWKNFKTKLGMQAKSIPDALILTLQGNSLSNMAKTVIAACMLQGIPVVFFSLPECSEALADEAHNYTGGTWPVFWQESKCAEYASTELVRILSLRNMLNADIDARISSFKTVNVAGHFSKRAAVALVPMGVMAVNFAGLVRLCGRMMVATGMVADKESQKATAKLGAITAGKVTVIDSLGDVYQFVIYTTVLADFAAAASLEAAMSTLTLADAFLLGSVSVVTGAISAVGAYYTRPQLVETIGNFLANVQLMYLLNPKMRRSEKAEDQVSGDENTTGCCLFRKGARKST